MAERAPRSGSRKLLIIAYHFPPDAAVGGTRPAKFAKYLARDGWQPYILTVRERYFAETDWSRLDEFLIAYLVEPSMRATVMASSLAATLELIREGVVEVHQHAAFAPIYLRKRDATAMAAPGSGATTPRAIE